MVSNMMFDIFRSLQRSTKLWTLDPLFIAEIFQNIQANATSCLFSTSQHFGNCQFYILLEGRVWRHPAGQCLIFVGTCGSQKDKGISVGQRPLALTLQKNGKPTSWNLTKSLRSCILLEDLAFSTNPCNSEFVLKIVDTVCIIWNSFGIWIHFGRSILGILIHLGRSSFGSFEILNT